MAQKLIVANWKMNPVGEKDALRLAKVADYKDTVVCPPFCFLPAVKNSIKRAALGAQDIFWENGGPYTGEISPAMLKNFGVKYVIVGHSERRRLGETDGEINKKVKAALGTGLKAILCVGESLAVRKRGLATAENFVKKQLREDLKKSEKLIKPKAENLLVAYEPIWAISTAHSAESRDNSDTPEDAAKMVKSIKRFLGAENGRLKTVKVLYGGSVDSKNAEIFLKLKEVDGALVGGASLKPKEIRKIIKIASTPRPLFQKRRGVKIK